MKNKKIETLLYKSLDSSLPLLEDELLENELQNSDELRSDFRQINRIRKAVEESAVTSFKPFFEERLLTKLNYTGIVDENLSLWSNTLALSFRQIGFAAMFILILLLSYNLKSGNNHSIENLFGKSKYGIEYAYDPVSDLLRSNK
jgi:hypothetical protein